MLDKKDMFIFFKQFLKSPKMVASIAPSSNALAEALINHSGVKSASFIVELGSGTGVVTKRVYEEMCFYSEFISIEVNEELAMLTKSRCPNVDVFCDNAVNIKNILLAKNATHCDSIVSCIPWATLSDDDQRAIIEQVHISLKSGGRFATLLLLPGLALPSTKRFVNLVSEVFGGSNCSKIVWKNVPPAIVLWAEKD
tara:strand:- start:9280 stop:9870 length:591 start_codon:yes stop_codon:yes gene_type:complete